MVDVAPIARALVDAVSENLPVQPTVPVQILVMVGGSDQRDLVDRIRDTPQQAKIVLVLVIAFAAGSLITAHRRLGALGWLGVGAVSAAIVVRIGSHLAVPEALDRSAAPSELGRRMQELLSDQVLASLDGLGLAVGAVGVVLAVVGLVGARFSR